MVSLDEKVSELDEKWITTTTTKLEEVLAKYLGQSEEASNTRHQKSLKDLTAKLEDVSASNKSAMEEYLQEIQNDYKDLSTKFQRIEDKLPKDLKEIQVFNQTVNGWFDELKNKDQSIDSELNKLTS